MKGQSQVFIKKCRTGISFKTRLIMIFLALAEFTVYPSGDLPVQLGTGSGLNSLEVFEVKKSIRISKKYRNAGFLLILAGSAAAFFADQDLGKYFGLSIALSGAGLHYGNAGAYMHQTENYLKDPVLLKEKLASAGTEPGSAGAKEGRPVSEKMKGMTMKHRADIENLLFTASTRTGAEDPVSGLFSNPIKSASFDIIGLFNDKATAVTEMLEEYRSVTPETGGVSSAVPELLFAAGMDRFSPSRRETEIVETKITASENTVYFYPGSTRIQEKSFSFLDRLADVLDLASDDTVSIEVRAGEGADREYDGKLSLGRAESILEYFTAVKKLPREKFSVSLLRERSPASDNGEKKTREGRIEINLK